MGKATLSQRDLFIEFMRNGFSFGLLPGQVTYSEVIRHLNLVSAGEQDFPGYGHSWFRDVFFWFNKDQMLTNLELHLAPLQSNNELPLLIGIEWSDFARELTPEIFEDLIISAQIPCLKATEIAEETIYPGIYCLDHIGLMPRFSDDSPYYLNRIDMRLLRSFPPLTYHEIWPPAYDKDSFVTFPKIATEVI